MTGILRTEQRPLHVELADAPECSMDSVPELMVRLRSRGCTRESDRLADRLAGADLAAEWPAMRMCRALVSPWDLRPMKTAPGFQGSRPPPPESCGVDRHVCQLGRLVWLSWMAGRAGTIRHMWILASTPPPLRWLRLPCPTRQNQPLAT